MQYLFTAGPFPALDGLRSLATVAVCFFHFSLFVGWPLGWVSEESLYSLLSPVHVSGGFNWWGAVAAIGCSSVDVFFVLSGFLLGRKLLERSVSMVELLVRRCLRLWPVMALNVLLATLAGTPTCPASGAADFIPWKYVVEQFPEDADMALCYVMYWSVAVDMYVWLVLGIIGVLTDTLWSQRNSGQSLRRSSVWPALVWAGPVYLAARAWMAASAPGVVSLHGVSVFSMSERSVQMATTFLGPPGHDPTLPELVADGQAYAKVAAIYFNVLTRGGALATGVVAWWLVHARPTWCVRVTRHWVTGTVLTALALLLTLGGMLGSPFVLPLPVQRQWLGLSPIQSKALLVVSRPLVALGMTLLLFVLSGVGDPRLASSDGTVGQQSSWLNLGAWVNRFLALPCFTPIAKCSFVVYSFHLGFIVAALAMPPSLSVTDWRIPSTLLLKFGQMMVPCLLVSVVLHLCFERPIVALLSRLASRVWHHDKAPHPASRLHTKQQ